MKERKKGRKKEETDTHGDAQKNPQAEAPLRGPQNTSHIKQANKHLGNPNIIHLHPQTLL